MLFAFRKTLLGPTYGSPLEKMQILPRSAAQSQKHYLAYITKDKVWGTNFLPSVYLWSILGLAGGLNETCPCRGKRSERLQDGSTWKVLILDKAGH